MNSDIYQKRYEEFHVGTFKVLGGIQMALGIICATISMIGVGIDGTDLSQPCKRISGLYYSYTSCQNVDLYLAFEATCLIFSGWIIMTGCLPFCMTEKKVEKWTCLKTAFMVCCIIGSAIFIPTILSLEITGALIRAVSRNNGTWKAAFPAIVAVFSFIELIVAIVSASYCCCCWQSKTRIYPIFINETGQPFVVLKDWQSAELGVHNRVNSDQTMIPLPLQGASLPVNVNRQMTQAIPSVQQDHVYQYQQVTQQPNQYSTMQHVPQQPIHYATMEQVPYQPVQYSTMPTVQTTNQHNLSLHTANLQDKLASQKQ